MARLCIQSLPVAQKPRQSAACDQLECAVPTASPGETQLAGSTRPAGHFLVLPGNFEALLVRSAYGNLQLLNRNPTKGKRSMKVSS